MATFLPFLAPFCFQFVELRTQTLRLNDANAHGACFGFTKAACTLGVTMDSGVCGPAHVPDEFHVRRASATHRHCSSRGPTKSPPASARTAAATTPVRNPTLPVESSSSSLVSPRLQLRLACRRRRLLSRASIFSVNIWLGVRFFIGMNKICKPCLTQTGR